MTGPDVPPSGTPSHDVPAPQPSLEDVLDGLRVPETEVEMSVAALTEALRAPARPDELATLDADVAAFTSARRDVLAGGAVVVPLAGRTRRRPAALAAAAVAGVTASVLLVGTAAAALTGTLPSPLQRVAHDLVGAPLPDDSSDQATASQSQSRSTTAGQPIGPNASTGAAVLGLCRAFGDRAPSAPATGSTAYAALLAAAEAKGVTVAEYCAGVLSSAKPTTPPGQTTKPSTPPGQTKKPTTPPGQTKKPTTPPGQTKKPTAPARPDQEAEHAPRPDGEAVHPARPDQVARQALIARIVQASSRFVRLLGRPEQFARFVGVDV